jgi:phospho-N-acetylmuramoyl-pentapeptide-transferase
MLYYLFEFLDKEYDLAGAGLFHFISFRAIFALLMALVVAMIYGKKFIRAIQIKQIGESIRDLGLEGQLEKAGTPTMGGLIIIFCILLPVLLFTRLENVYIILLLISTVWMGLIGFLDDYIKVFRKNKEGLPGKLKVVGQIGLGLIVGLTLYYNQNVVVRHYHDKEVTLQQASKHLGEHQTGEGFDEVPYHDVKSTVTTIPFLKGNEFDYSKISSWIGLDITPIIYVLVVIFIVTAVSNGANITDGIDGLAAGTSAIIGVVLAIFAYVSGNVVFADYLNIMYLPHTGEIVVFAAAFIGACVGFLWYNSYPAKVFMGDTGSLCLGGLIAVMALSVRKELLIPILCGIFLIENLSVILQVSYFKYTKKKYGEGRRIFLMSPLHHHYQKQGMHEAKIVTRFWIVGILLAAFTLATLKLR